MKTMKVLNGVGITIHSRKNVKPLDYSTPGTWSGGMIVIQIRYYKAHIRI